MNFIEVIQVFFIFLLFSSGTADPTLDNFIDYSTDISVGREPVPKIENVVVEVLIICDVDFSSMFQFNRLEILNYFEALFWDVHLRYTTLKNVSISFVVTEIIILENAEQQPFIEDARNREGLVSIEKSLFDFDKWVNDLDTKVHYDIAVAVTGALFCGRAVGMSRLYGTCLKGKAHQKTLSTMMQTMRTNDIGRVTSHEIGHLPGAPHDDDVSYYDYNCGPYYKYQPAYIMDSGKMFPGMNSYFFSACSGKAIDWFLQTTQARSCLKDKPSNSKKPIIDTKKMSDGLSALTGISIERQCQLLMNDTTAYVLKGETSCFHTKCRDGTENEFHDEFTFLRPLEGSPCDNGYCFRGYCRPTPIPLINMASKNCLKNAIQRSLKDLGKPTLQNCTNIGTNPLSSIKLKYTGDNEIIMYTFSSIPDGLYDTFERCLTTDKKGSCTYQKCRSDASSGYSSINWEVIHVGASMNVKDGVEFLLKNKAAKLCLTWNENLNVVQAASCSVHDSRMKWTVFSDEQSIDLFDNMQTFVGLYPNVSQPTYSWSNVAFDCGILLITILQAFVLYMTKVTFKLNWMGTPKCT